MCDPSLRGLPSRFAAIRPTPRASAEVPYGDPSGELDSDMTDPFRPVPIKPPQSPWDAASTGSLHRSASIPRMLDPCLRAGIPSDHTRWFELTCRCSTECSGKQRGPLRLPPQARHRPRPLLRQSIAHPTTERIGSLRQAGRIVRAAEFRLRPRLRRRLRPRRRRRPRHDPSRSSGPPRLLNHSARQRC